MLDSKYCKLTGKLTGKVMSFVLKSKLRIVVQDSFTPHPNLSFYFQQLLYFYCKNAFTNR